MQYRFAQHCVSQHDNFFSVLFLNLLKLFVEILNGLTAFVSSLMMNSRTLLIDK